METTAPTLTLKTIYQLIADDFTALNSLTTQQLRSQVPLIEEIGHYITAAGGKRLRPLMVLLMANALDYQGDEHQELATVIEFIHTATLLHDDVIDKSELRRGQKTANALWGNTESVLVGDFLYSRAFQILAQRNNIPVMKVLANATNALSEGEVQQLLNMHDIKLSETNYLQVVTKKTAKLFEAAASIGAMTALPNPKIQRACADYGLNFGIAYQLIDDLLDYTCGSKKMGKNLGDDLAEGKPTLPLLYAFAQGTPTQQKLMQQTITTGNLQKLPEVISIMQKTGALQYTLEQAKRYAQLAQENIAILEDSLYKDALIFLADFITARDF